MSVSQRIENDFSIGSVQLRIGQVTQNERGDVGVCFEPSLDLPQVISKAKRIIHSGCLHDEAGEPIYLKCQKTSVADKFRAISLMFSDLSRGLITLVGLRRP